MSPAVSESSDVALNAIPIRVCEKSERHEHRQGGRGQEHDQGKHPDGNSAADGDAVRSEGADLERARIRMKDLLKPVAQNDREAERREQRRERIWPHRPVQEYALQGIAQAEHQRRHRQDREERIEVHLHDRPQREIGGENQEVAMSDVDQAHDAVGDRKADREQRVKPAEKNALKNRVEPFDHVSGPQSQSRRPKSDPCRGPPARRATSPDRA